MHHTYQLRCSKFATKGEPTDPKEIQYDDIEVIRKAVEDLVDQGKTVALVGHSAGAFLGSHALQHLTTKAREEAGKPGAVVKLAFITGALLPPGHDHGPAPFMDIQVGKRAHPNLHSLRIWLRHVRRISMLITIIGRQAILQSSTRDSIQ